VQRERERETVPAKEVVASREIGREVHLEEGGIQRIYHGGRDPSAQSDSTVSKSAQVRQRVAQ
jgi:hypothetical protein